MTQTFTIRPAGDGDGPGIAALIAAVFSEYENCPFVPAEFPELAAPASHYARIGGRLFVAEDAAGHIVGCFGLSCRDGNGIFELHKVYVDRAFRGAGLAQALYAEALALATARGARVLKLWTDTRFAAGHRFYEKLGFMRQPVIRYLADASEAWEYGYRLQLDPSAAGRS